jgi:hypothetical protein
VLEIVLHAHRCYGAHAGERVYHHANQGAVTKPAELGYVN